MDPNLSPAALPLAAFAAGAALTGSLIIGPGPQNLHVLRTGLARRHVAPTVALCVGADALLITLGLAGAGATALPAALGGPLRWLAVALLLGLAWRSLREAGPGHAEDALSQPSHRAALGLAAWVTFANPAVWIETVLVVGSAGAVLAGGQRLAFGAGAIAASAAWFCTLGFGAGRLAPTLSRPAVLRTLQQAGAWLCVGLALRLLLTGTPA